MEDQNNKKHDALDVVFGVACLLVVIVFLIYIANFWNRPIATDASSWGAFGDYIGGVINPILGFFSFMALLITLDLQRKQLVKTEEQLQLNREELIDTRKELARSAQAQEDSKRIMNEQLKTQFLQQFDSLFFSLLNQMTENLGSLQGGDNKSAFQSNYSEIFDIKTIPNFVAQKILNHEFDANLTIENMRSKLIEKKDISNLFIFLYQLLKNIDNKIEASKLFDDIEKCELKKNYFNIVRSLIPEKILHLLILNVYSGGQENNFNKYKKLVEISSLFEHINLIESSSTFYPVLLCSSKINSSAFGSNEKFKFYREHLFYQSLEQDKTGYLLGVLNTILENSSFEIHSNDFDFKDVMLNIDENIHYFHFKIGESNKLLNELQYTNKINKHGKMVNCDLIDDNKILLHFKNEDNSAFQLELTLKKNTNIQISSIVV